MSLFELIKTKVSVILGILLLVVVFGLVTSSSSGGSRFAHTNNEASAIASLSSDAILQLEIADSQQERITGLSGRASLPDNTGLLFVFEESDSYGIWMKDMLFSIDIIWLDEDYTVVGLKESVSPDSYPEVFYPDMPARYVVEVNAGFVANQGLEKGERFEIEF